MTTRVARPGFGDHAIIRNPVKGTEWIVEVLYWGSTGAPFAVDLHTAERRWFPPHWVAEVDPGNGPRECSCDYPGIPGDDREVTAPTIDPRCDVHISDARRKELTR